MKNKIFFAIIIVLLLTTFNTSNKKNYIPKFKIDKIIIENNFIVTDKKIKKQLSFLYEKNLFLLNSKEINQKLNKLEFIESFKIKKIYPNKIKIIIYEKKPIAVLNDKKEKFFLTDNNEVINYSNIQKFEELPIIFGNKESFEELNNSLNDINFPKHEISTFLLFESGRWDLITKENKVIKLPIKNYKQSLENFKILRNQNNLKKYKLFDYRISNQLILK